MTDLKQFYYKKNRLTQLRGFYNVIKFGNITKAAQNMGLTQSTVTLQIQSLERDLDCKIFDRKSGILKLTQDGDILYSMVSSHLNAIDSIYKNFLEKKNNIKPLRINVALHHVAISYLMPKYVKEFTKIHPEVTIGIQNISSDLAFKRLLNDEVDISIFPNIESCNDFVAQEFDSFDPILIMSKDHPLTKKRQIELRDISEYNVVRIDKNLITLPLFEEAFKEFNFKSNIDFENADWEIIKHFVRNKIGLGFVSTMCINEKDDDLVYYNLKKYFPVMNYKIIVKKGKILNNVITDFINIVKNT